MYAFINTTKLSQSFYRRPAAPAITWEIRPHAVVFTPMVSTWPTRAQDIFHGLSMFCDPVLYAKGLDCLHAGNLSLIGRCGPKWTLNPQADPVAADGRRDGVDNQGQAPLAAGAPAGNNHRHIAPRSQRGCRATCRRAGNKWGWTIVDDRGWTKAVVFSFRSAESPPLTGWPCAWQSARLRRVPASP